VNEPHRIASRRVRCLRSSSRGDVDRGCFERLLRLLTALALCVALGAACSPTSRSAPSDTLGVGSSLLVDSRGRVYRVGELLTRAPWTVFVFFSATCPTVAAHDERLRRLPNEFRERDVAWFMIASEAETTLVDLAREHNTRGYPFPLLRDQDGALARLLGVRYASQALILDRHGAVVYAGSIDSDRRFLHADAEPYLQRALGALIDGERPSVSDERAYGCALRFER
jgi:peroxiredoxin